MLYKYLIIVLISICCLIGVVNANDKPVQKFKYDYLSYECYKSDINPHKILKDWILLGGDLIDNNIYVMMGNPKINWDLYDIIDPYILSDKEDVDIQVVYFIFKKVKFEDVKLQLISYVWLDREKVERGFTANPSRECYIKIQ